MEPFKENIIDAFRVIDRKDFVLKEYENEAYEDIPLPIGLAKQFLNPQLLL